MNALIGLLEEKRNKAQQDLDEAQKRLKTWVEAIELAQKTDGLSVTHDSATKPKKGGPSIPDLIKEILKEQGSLRPAQIHHFVQEKGKITAIGNINVALNR